MDCKEKQEKIEYYAGNNMRHLKKLCDPIIAKKFLPEMYRDDLYSDAQKVLMESVESYRDDSGVAFKDYLKGNIKNSFWEWSRNSMAQKRCNVLRDKNGKPVKVKDENGNEMSLRGKSIGGGNAVITRLNGVDVDLTGNYSTIVVQHIDKKGTLAFVTAVLSAYDLNIGSLRLYRESKGKMAYAIIEVDTMVSSQVINALRGFEAVKNVLLVPAINLD